MNEWLEGLVKLAAEAMQKQQRLHGRVNFDSAYNCIFPEMHIPPDAKKTYKSGVKREIRKVGLLEPRKKPTKKDGRSLVFSQKKLSSLAKQSQGKVWQENLP